MFRTLEREPEWEVDVLGRIGKSSLETLGAGAGLLATGSQMIGAEGMRDWAIEKAQNLFQSAADVDVVSTEFKELATTNPLEFAEKAAKFFIERITEFAPDMLAMAAGGAGLYTAGTKVAGKIGGKQALEGMMKRQVRKNMYEISRKKGLKEGSKEVQEMAYKMAVGQVGAMSGLAAYEGGQGAGAAYIKDVEERGVEDASALGAAAVGLGQAAVTLISPFNRAIAGLGAKKGFTDVSKMTIGEAAEEVAQGSIEKMHDAGINPYLTIGEIMDDPQTYIDLAEQGVVGAIVGGTYGGLGRAISKEKDYTKQEKVYEGILSPFKNIDKAVDPRDNKDLVEGRDLITPARTETQARIDAFKTDVEELVKTGTEVSTDLAETMAKIREAHATSGSIDEWLNQYDPEAPPIRPDRDVAEAQYEAYEPGVPGEAETTQDKQFAEAIQFLMDEESTKQVYLQYLKNANKKKEEVPITPAPQTYEEAKAAQTPEQQAIDAEMERQMAIEEPTVEEKEVAEFEREARDYVKKSWQDKLKKEAEVAKTKAEKELQALEKEAKDAEAKARLIAKRERLAEADQVIADKMSQLEEDTNTLDATTNLKDKQVLRVQIQETAKEVEDIVESKKRIVAAEEVVTPEVEVTPEEQRVSEFGEELDTEAMSSDEVLNEIAKEYPDVITGDILSSDPARWAEVADTLKEYANPRSVFKTVKASFDNIKKKYPREAFAIDERLNLLKEELTKEVGVAKKETDKYEWIQDPDDKNTFTTTNPETGEEYIATKSGKKTYLFDTDNNPVGNPDGYSSVVDARSAIEEIDPIKAEKKVEEEKKKPSYQGEGLPQEEVEEKPKKPAKTVIVRRKKGEKVLETRKDFFKSVKGERGAIEFSDAVHSLGRGLYKAGMTIFEFTKAIKTELGNKFKYIKDYVGRLYDDVKAFHRKIEKEGGYIGDKEVAQEPQKRPVKDVPIEEVVPDPVIPESVVEATEKVPYVVKSKKGKMYHMQWNKEEDKYEGTLIPEKEFNQLHEQYRIRNNALAVDKMMEANVDKQTTAKEKFSSFTKDLKGLTKDVVMGTVERIRKMSPKAAQIIKDYESRMHLRGKEWKTNIIPFIKKYNRLPRDVKMLFRYSVMRGDTTTRNEILDEHNLNDEFFGYTKEDGERFDGVQGVLNQIEELSDRWGILDTKIKDYFPRVLADMEGLQNHLSESGNRISLVEAQVEQAREQALRNNEPFTPADEQKIIADLMAGGNYNYLPKPGASKERALKLIKPEMLEYYHDVGDTLIHHIQNMNEAIGARELIGRNKVRQSTIKKMEKVAREIDSLTTKLENAKDDAKEGIQAKIDAKVNSFNAMTAKVDLVEKELEDSISSKFGEYIKGEDQKEFIDLIRARLMQRGAHGAVANIRDVGYAMALGQVTSAVTQIGDTVWSIYRNNPLNTMKGAARAIKALIEGDALVQKDMDFSQQLRELTSMSSTSKILDTALTWSGLKHMDMFAKETAMRATLEKAKGMEFEQFKEEYGDLISESEIKQTYKDVQDGTKSDRALRFLLNDLSDWQPITLS
jgi:hypothetical protein